MKKRTLTKAAYITLPILGIALLGIGTASAHGMFGFGTTATPDEIAARHEQMFEQEASLLGVSVDAVKSGWAAGKGIAEIASDNGISADVLRAKLDAARQEKLRSALQALVSKGIITQAQADQRLATMQSKQGVMAGKRGGMMRGLPF